MDLTLVEKLYSNILSTVNFSIPNSTFSLQSQFKYQNQTPIQISCEFKILLNINSNQNDVNIIFVLQT